MSYGPIIYNNDPGGCSKPPILIPIWSQCAVQTDGSAAAILLDQNIDGNRYFAAAAHQLHNLTSKCEWLW